MGISEQERFLGWIFLCIWEIGRRDGMKGRGFRAGYSWEWRYCPVCCGRLGMGAVFCRRVGKVFKCRKCGSRIDERFVKW